MPSAEAPSLPTSLTCEWEDEPCGRPTHILSKGCSDARQYAICPDHLDELKHWFDSNKGAICGCGRMFINFETHYNIVDLSGR
ncbi:hypothetical protein MHAEM_21166 [Mycolicibacterium phlei]|nr:hypothetical protein [Mycolicibacterium phlei]